MGDADGCVLGVRDHLEVGVGLPAKQKSGGTDLTDIVEVRYVESYKFQHFSFPSSFCDKNQQLVTPYSGPPREP